jgi:hypothetical protein
MIDNISKYLDFVKNPEERSSITNKINIILRKENQIMTYLKEQSNILSLIDNSNTDTNYISKITSIIESLISKQTDIESDINERKTILTTTSNFNDLHGKIKFFAYLSNMIYSLNSNDTFKISEYKYFYNYNNLIIVCKGTSNFDNIKTDLYQGIKTSYHKGMLESAIKILFNNPQSNLLNMINESNKIYLTGHSLGAGICIYLLIIIKLILGLHINKSIELFLYGCPPVIPASIINTVSTHIYQINNELDQITESSMGLQLKPANIIIKINSKQDALLLTNSGTHPLTNILSAAIEGKGNVLQYHKMANYIKNIANIKSIKIPDLQPNIRNLASLNPIRWR